MDTETKARHTSGPWFPVEYAECKGTWHIDATGNNPFIADVCSGNGEYPSEANARIIAAAPDLLAAVEAILQRIDLEPKEAVFPCSAMREDLRAAIRKARGSQ